MKVKAIVDEDFVNYKKPSLLIMMPHCTWKCGIDYCHNSPLANAPDIDIDIHDLVDRYMNNSITEAIVFSGLEPFVDFHDMFLAIEAFRGKTEDPIIIYTGYYLNEIFDNVQTLQFTFPNIIIKFGRYQPGEIPHLDDVLGVLLASDNQYAKKIS